VAKRLFILVGALLCLISNVCSQSTIDYSNIKHWFAHPTQQDASDKSPFAASDSLPATDVFFILPSTYFKGFRKNSSINKRSQRKKAQLVLLNEASVFSGLSSVYSPEYRQVRQHVLLHRKGVKKTQALELAYEDVRTAFLHYMSKWNNGRPIILASHGQGSLHAQRLLTEFFDSTFYNQLIVAYIPGYPLPYEVVSKNFNRVEVCTSDTTTRCICTWQTFGKNSFSDHRYNLHFWMDDSYVAKYDSQVHVVNPLSWIPNQDSLIKTQGVRALRPSNNIRIPLRTIVYNPETTVKDGKLFLYGENKMLFNSTAQNYYRYDYNLFYQSIRENSELRIRSFNMKN
jgi:Protein of unknown function (DUF3089)